MTQPPHDPPPSTTLDYRTTARSRWSAGRVIFLIFSIILSLGVAGLCTLAAGFMLDDHHPDFVILLVTCPVALLAFFAFLMRKRGFSVALALTIISVITFLLMLGLCSQVQIHI